MIVVDVEDHLLGTKGTQLVDSGDERRSAVAATAEGVVDLDPPECTCHRVLSVDHADLPLGDEVALSVVMDSLAGLPRRRRGSGWYEPFEDLVGPQVFAVEAGVFEDPGGVRQVPDGETLEARSMGRGVRPGAGRAVPVTQGVLDKRAECVRVGLSSGPEEVTDAVASDTYGDGAEQIGAVGGDEDLGIDELIVEVLIDRSRASEPGRCDRRLSSANKCDESGLHQPLASCSSNRVPLPAPRPSLMPSTVPFTRNSRGLLGTALR